MGVPVLLQKLKEVNWLTDPNPARMLPGCVERWRGFLIVSLVLILRYSLTGSRFLHGNEVGIHQLGYTNENWFNFELNLELIWIWLDCSQFRWFPECVPATLTKSTNRAPTSASTPPSWASNRVRGSGATKVTSSKPKVSTRADYTIKQLQIHLTFSIELSLKSTEVLVGKAQLCLQIKRWYFLFVHCIPLAAGILCC